MTQQIAAAAPRAVPAAGLSAALGKTESAIWSIKAHVAGAMMLESDFAPAADFDPAIAESYVRMVDQVHALLELSQKELTRAASVCGGVTKDNDVVVDLVIILSAVSALLAGALAIQRAAPFDFTDNLCACRCLVKDALEQAETAEGNIFRALSAPAVA